MGIGDWIKRNVGELVIARPDDAKNFIVWKHPDPTIPKFSQLTVNSDEQAVFFRDGKVVGTLGPGRHTLDSTNIPFLSNLLDSVTGGRLFITEVFFVTMRENTGVKYGGPIGNVEDPKSGIPVQTMVHGEFSFKVTNPEQLIIGLVGTGRVQNYDVRAWLKEQVLKVIRDRIAELLVKNKWPLLDVTSGAYTEEIETTVLSGLGTHVASYGLVIVRLGNFEIAINEDDAKNLKKLYTDAAYIRTVGGVGAYQQFAAGKAMMGAGEGMAKGGGGGGGDAAGAGLLGGAGLGVGLGMAQMMMNQQNQARGGGGGGGGGTVGGEQPAPTTPNAPAGEGAAGGTAARAKFCVNCGSGLPEAGNFCPNCGTKRG
ncbi:MAG: SPFH domain-containing protein [Planctomycetes bacterium]|nr:SPFH domain-containing protein [Planctomycetota bacterium]